MTRRRPPARKRKPDSGPRSTTRHAPGESGETASVWKSTSYSWRSFSTCSRSPFVAAARTTARPPCRARWISLTASGSRSSNETTDSAPREITSPVGTAGVSADEGAARDLLARALRVAPEPDRIRHRPARGARVLVVEAEQVGRRFELLRDGLGVVDREDEGGRVVEDPRRRGVAGKKRQQLFEAVVLSREAGVARKRRFVVGPPAGVQDLRRRASGSPRVSDVAARGGRRTAPSDPVERCVSGSNVRSDATRSPSNSTRTGSGSWGGKMSTSPPRTATSPHSVTRSART